MAFRSQVYALGVKVQSAVNTPATISTSTDLLACYDLSPQSETYTLANPESTGAVERVGDIVMGRSRSITFKVILRGPGGSSPPSADAWVPGRILRAARFTEVSQTSALLAAGAISSGTTTGGVLPVGASGTDDFYNGLPAILSDQGSGVRGITMIRDYVGSSRTATFMETFAVAPAANVSVPAFLGYRYLAGAAELFLSVDWWMDKKRYHMTNGVVTNLQLNFPVNNNADTAFTYMDVTITGDVAATAEIDENAPTMTALGNPPVFRDADWWLDNKSLCGSSCTVDFSIQSERPPCPNSLSGGEAPQVVSVTRSANLNLNEVLLTAADWNAIADAQTYKGLWLQYGNTSGKVVSFGIMDGRIGYSEAENGGSFVTRQVSMMVDGIDKSMSLVFPYWS